MNSRLQPMTLGEVLDRTAQFYRSSFLSYWGIAIPPSAAILMLSLGSLGFRAWLGSRRSAGVTGHEAVILFGAAFVLGLLITLPLYLGAKALSWAALCDAAANGLKGQKVGIREAYRRAWMHGWRYVGLLLLLILIVASVPIVVMVLIGGVSAILLAGNSSSGVLATSVGIVDFFLIAILVAYTIWMLLRMALVIPACVVEKVGAWSAVKRGWQLSRKAKGRIFVTWLLMAVLSWILAAVFMIPAWIGIALIPSMRSPAHAAALGTAVLTVWYVVWYAVRSVLMPLYGISFTLIYFDQRVRMEGFDIEWLMQQAGMEQEPAPQPERQPWLPPAGIGAEPTVADGQPGGEDGEPPVPGVAQP